MYRKYRWIPLLLLVATILSGCSYTSTLYLDDGNELEIEITQSDKNFVYGIKEGEGLVKILRTDISKIEFVGEGHIPHGIWMTATGGAAGIAGGAILLSNPDMGGAFLAMGLMVIIGAPLLATGVPILTWGVINRNEAQDLSGWQEAMQSIRPTPIVLSDGENNHYGLGISGRF